MSICAVLKPQPRTKENPRPEPKRLENIELPEKNKGESEYKWGKRCELAVKAELKDRGQRIRVKPMQALNQNYDFVVMVEGEGDPVVKAKKKPVRRAGPQGGTVRRPPVKKSR